TERHPRALARRSHRDKPHPALPESPQRASHPCPPPFLVSRRELLYQRIFPLSSFSVLFPWPPSLPLPMNFVNGHPDHRPTRMGERPHRILHARHYVEILRHANRACPGMTNQHLFQGGE